MTEFEAILRLSLTKGIGARTYKTLVETFGSAEAIFNAKRRDVEAIHGIGEKLAHAITEEARNVDIASEITFAQKKTFRLYLLPASSTQII